MDETHEVATMSNSAIIDNLQKQIAELKAAYDKVETLRQKQADEIATLKDDVDGQELEIVTLVHEKTDLELKIAAMKDAEAILADSDAAKSGQVAELKDVNAKQNGMIMYELVPLREYARKQDEQIAALKNGMEVDINENGAVRLKKVFNGVVFEAEGGECLAVCMRDDAYEVGVYQKGHDPTWFGMSSQRIDPRGPNAAPLLFGKAPIVYEDPALRCVICKELGDREAFVMGVCPKCLQESKDKISGKTNKPL